MIQAAIVVAVTTLASAGMLIAWLHRRLVVIDVEGKSMQPTLCAGDRVVVRRRPLRHIRAGDIVVFENAKHRQRNHHPAAAARSSRNLSDHVWIIKRAAAVPGDPVPASVAATVSAAAGTSVPDGCLVALEDNPARSTDSRAYGYVSGDRLLGVVVRRLRPSSSSAC